MEEFEHTLQSFDALPIDERLRIARKKAERIDVVEDENYKTDLYSYCDFFIELIFRKELNIIKSIEGISALDYADKYIELEDMDDF